MRKPILCSISVRGTRSCAPRPSLGLARSSVLQPPYVSVRTELTGLWCSVNSVVFGVGMGYGG